MTSIGSLNIFFVILSLFRPQEQVEHTRIPILPLSYLQIEHYMKMRLQYAVLVLFVLLANSCGKEPLESPAVLETENAVPIEQELLVMVNNYRNTLGYSTLEFSSVAYVYANQHTDYMIAKGNINHDGFTSRASDISTKVDASAVAENVAKDYPTAKITFEKWVASSGHRKNIEGDFTHTAVSVKKDAAGHYYFTQLFYR